MRIKYEMKTGETSWILEKWYQKAFYIIGLVGISIYGFILFITILSTASELIK